LTTDADGHRDGVVHDAGRLADTASIENLATSYAHAVDDRDWSRWEALFLPNDLVDYTRAGGIKGTPSEVAEWMVEAMATFTFCLHTTATHEIRFTGLDTAGGRVHVFDRNGVVWNGHHELFDVGARYDDAYVRLGDTWRMASRIEHTRYVTGGAFADLIRDMVNDPSSGLPRVFG